MNREDDYYWVADCRGGAEVKRGHTIPFIRQYTVGHHTFNAQMIAMYLADQNDLNRNDKLNLFIIISTHDMPELFTGDMPSNFKKANPLIADEIFKAEMSWIKRHLPPSMQLFIDCDNEQPAGLMGCIIKLADGLELLWWCVEELEMGNRRIHHVYTNILTYLKEFMDHHHEIKGVHRMILDMEQRADEVMNYGG
jgi:5'-deoxynucleotidase YfbR-like HD superfamily hydrolase